MPEKENPKFDSKRETRVLLEDVRSQLRVVAEGHGLLVIRLDRVEAKLSEHDHRFDRIEVRLDHMEGQLSQLQNQVGSVLTDHESRIKVLEAPKNFS